MASEITRIANATDYNGIHLLDGNLSSDTHVGTTMAASGKLKVHFGTANDSAEDYYYIKIGTSTASALGVGNQAVGTEGLTVSTQDAAQEPWWPLTTRWSPRTRFGHTWARCKTGWKTPYPT